MSRIIDKQRFKRIYPSYKVRPVEETTGGSDGGAEFSANDATFIVINNTSDLPNERSIQTGIGMNGSDGGAGGAYTLSVDPNLVAFVSGATFVQLSGSLQRTGENLSYLVAGSGISIFSQSNGQIVISSTSNSSGSIDRYYGFCTGSMQWFAYPNWTGFRAVPGNWSDSIQNGVSRGAIGSTTSSFTVSSSGVYHFYSNFNVYNANLTYAALRLTSSIAGTLLQHGYYTGGSSQPPFILEGIVDLVEGVDYGVEFATIGGVGSPWNTSDPIGGPGSTAENQRTGEISFVRLNAGSSSTSSGGSGDPGASYVVLSTTSSLSNERALAVAGGLTLTDGGSNNSVTIGVSNDTIATISGSSFTQLSGSLQRTSGGISYLAAGANINIVSASNGQIVVSAHDIGDSAAQYLVLANTSSLPNERSFAAGTGITTTDGGAGSTFTVAINNNVVGTISGSTFTQLSGSLQRTSSGLSYLVGGTGVNVASGTASSAGQIVVKADDNVVAMVSGSTFTGAVKFNSGLSGSLTQLTDGRSFIVGTGAVTVTSSSNGQIIISGSGGSGSGSGAPADATYLTLTSNGTLTNERTFTAGTGILTTDGGANSTYTVGIDNNVVATVSGTSFTGGVKFGTYTAGTDAFVYVSGTTGFAPGQSQRKVAVFQGDVVASGTISGSITQTAGGVSYLVALGALGITSSSAGQVFISGSSYAPRESTYVTIASDPTLTSERSLSAGTGLTLTDGGAGSTVSLAINNNVVATISGTTFTGIVSASAGLSGSLQQVGPGLPYLLSQGSITITTQSNGQIIISGSGGGASSGGAPADATYLTLSSNATLSNERTFTPGTGLFATDAGANSTYTLAINNNVVATVSGTKFTGPLTASLGIHSLSQSLFSSTPIVTLPDVFFYVSGSQFATTTNDSRIAVFQGDVVLSATLNVSSSVTVTADNQSSMFVATNYAPNVNGANVKLQKARGNKAVPSGVLARDFIGGFFGRGFVSGAADFGSQTHGYVVLRAGEDFTSTNQGTDFTIQLVKSGTTTLADVFTVNSLGNTAIVQKGATRGQSTILAVTGAAHTGLQASTESPDVHFIFGRTVQFQAGNIATQRATVVQAPSYSFQAASTITNAATVMIEGAPAAGSNASISNSYALWSAGNTRVDGRLDVTGSSAFSAGVSGSLTQLTNGTSYLVALGGVTITSQSNGQVFVSASVDAPKEATYITIANDPTLTSERALAAGTGLTLTDGGAGSTVTLAINNNVVATVSGTTFTGIVSASAGLSGSLQQVGPGLPYLLTQGGISITSQSNGQLIVSSSRFAPNEASYVVISADPTLSSERTLTAGTGLLLTDGGAGGAATLSINNNVVATVSGTRFTGPVTGTLGLNASAPSLFSSTAIVTGPDAFFYVSGTTGFKPGETQRRAAVFQGDVVASGTISGSIHVTSAGVSYLVAGSNVTITSASNGQIFIASTATGSGVTAVTGTWRDPGNTFVTTGSVSIDASNRTAATVGTDVFMFVSGTTGFAPNQSQRKVAVFQGDVVASGTISGSIMQTAAGASYLVAGSNITIVSASNGQIFISAAALQAAGTGWLAPTAGAQVTTGSVSIDTSNRQATALGTDVFFFVSGSQYIASGSTNRKVALFGGDVIMSGALVIASASGGRTQTIQVGTDANLYVSGTQYVATGANRKVSVFGGDMWVSGALVVASASGGRTQSIQTGTDTNFYVSGTQYVASGANRRVAVLAGDAWVSGSFVVASGSGGRAERIPVGTDVSLFVSGTRKVSTGSNRKIAVFAGDVVVSGTVAFSSGSSSLPRDVNVYFSGSTGLSGSNNPLSARSCVLFDTDIVISGSIQQNRPSLAPKTNFVQITSQSVTSNSTPVIAFTWQMPSGTTSVDALVTATSANVTQVATFRKLSLFRSSAGTFVQEGTAGGMDAGNITTSGLTWSVALNNINANLQLVLTGAASTTITWGWNLFVTEVIP